MGRRVCRGTIVALAAATLVSQPEEARARTTSRTPKPSITLRSTSPLRARSAGGASLATDDALRSARRKRNGRRRRPRRLPAPPRATRSGSASGQRRPFELPNYAIHAAMLPTGKILFWGFPTFPDAAESRRGRALGSLPGLSGPMPSKDVDPPLVDPDGEGPQGMVAAPIYCSGQSFLPTGELLVTGGNLAWTLPGSAL